jgi:peptidoglycan hydrolase-like protein with peptidoglycan-binding domain
MKDQFDYEGEPSEVDSVGEEYEAEYLDPYAEFDPEWETFEADLAQAEGEEEARRGRSSAGRSIGFRRRTARRRPPSRRPWPPRRPPRPFPWPQPAAVIEAPPSVEGPPQGTEYVRWVQSSLNRIMGLRLPVDGLMGPDTRSAVRSFQRRQGLSVDGIVGPETQRALLAARGSGAADEELLLSGNELEASVAMQEESFTDRFGRISSGLGSTVDREVDAVSGASGTRIIDLTAKADKSKRKGARAPRSVYALVLHQMACCFRRDPLKGFLRLNAHFAILPDGRILQLHPISALLWASHGFNTGSVAVEFAGNFPNTNGKWWKGETYGRNRVTPAQIEAGRYLVRYLIRTMGLTHILAHRQSSGTRENDPGPDIWYHVGQWAVGNLGLKDGGPGFKVGTGNPIPDAWRTWGRTRPTPELEAADSEDYETEDSQYEGPLPERYDEALAQETWEGEVSRSSPAYIRWVQSSLNRIMGLRLAVDGIMGSQTRSAVRSFQQQRGLVVDGVVGSRTEAALIAAGAGPPPVSINRNSPQYIRWVQSSLNQALGMSLAVDGVMGTQTRAAVRRFQQQRGLTVDGIVGIQTEAALIAVTGTLPPGFAPPAGGCPPFKARIRIHAKVLQAPNIPIATMVDAMRQVYGPAGFLVELGSTENLNLPALVDIDVGSCTVGNVTAEQQQLFTHRQGAGNNDVVVYFVRSTVPPFNGCAAHPAGRPGAVVAQGATQWTLGHEVGHVLGLNHVNNNDRLMTGNGTANITNPPPDLVTSEVQTIDSSSLSTTC